MEVNKKMIPTGASNPYSEFNTAKRIEDKSFDICFSVLSSEAIAEIILTDPKLNSSLCVWQETGINKYNFLQVYTPDHRETIAIEPMTCMPDALNNHNGLIVLKPGEVISMSWGIKKS